MTEVELGELRYYTNIGDIVGFKNVLRQVAEKAKTKSTTIWDEKDEFGYTLLHWACWNGKPDFVTALNLVGASNDIRLPNGQTPLHVALGRGQFDAAKAIIVDNPKSLNTAATDQWGRTSLHVAAIKGSKDVVSGLIDIKADPKLRDHRGWTPLHYCASYDRHDLVDIIMKGKPDVNAVNKEGWTALHAAAAGGHDMVLVALLERHGADVNAQTVDGQTALHLAVKSGINLAVQILLENDANPDITDSTGATPLDSLKPSDSMHTLVLNTQSKRFTVAEKCTLIDQTKNPAIGANNSFLIQARDEKGRKRGRGGEVFSVSVSTDKKANIDARIVDLKNGSYQLIWSSDSEGIHYITVKYKDDEIDGSPFRVDIGAPEGTCVLKNIYVREDSDQEIEDGIAMMTHSPKVVAEPLDSPLSQSPQDNPTLTTISSPVEKQQQTSQQQPPQTTPDSKRKSAKRKSSKKQEVLSDDETDYMEKLEAEMNSLKTKGYLETNKSNKRVSQKREKGKEKLDKDDSDGDQKLEVKVVEAPNTSDGVKKANSPSALLEPPPPTGRGSVGRNGRRSTSTSPSPSPRTSDQEDDNSSSGSNDQKQSLKSSNSRRKSENNKGEKQQEKSSSGGSEKGELTRVNTQYSSMKPLTKETRASALWGSGGEIPVERETKSKDSRKTLSRNSSTESDQGLAIDLEAKVEALKRENALLIQKVKEQQTRSQELTEELENTVQTYEKEREEIKSKMIRLATLAKEEMAKSKCTVCQINIRDAVLVPCMHFMFCYACTQQMTQCHHCGEGKKYAWQVKFN